MNTTAPPYELQAIEKLREEELEEARAIQSMMLPSEALYAGAVTISHEFQPIAAVHAGGSSMTTWQRRCFIFAIERRQRRVPTKAYRE